MSLETGVATAVQQLLERGVPEPDAGLDALIDQLVQVSPL
jgi:hypothetical protein